MCIISIRNSLYLNILCVYEKSGDSFSMNPLLWINSVKYNWKKFLYSRLVLNGSKKATAGSFVVIHYLGLF